jgi:hypothetical protein
MSMSMGMGGHGGMGWGLMRSLRRDDSVTQQQLPKGIVRRIAGFARPYRKALGVFLVLIIIDAVIGAANPLIYREIIDTGILKHRSGLIVELALVVAGLAVFDAVLSLWQRWVSARIGEGLIFDMRTRVFEHIQKMPIAFFTRTQTGALVSRLNNDVLGAQQAFTDTFSSVVSNVIGVAITLAAMFYLSWPITLVALALLPIFLLPARFVGRRLASITRESYTLNAQMTNTMTERFNVAGALLVKLFGHSRDEVKGFSDKAGRVRDIGVTQAMYTRVFMAALLLTASLATALVYGWGGVRAADRRGADRVSDAPVRAPDGAVERPSRHHDRTRVIRPGVRGTRPPPHDRRQARRGRHPPWPRADRVRPRRLRLPERRRGVAGIVGVGRGPRAHRVTAGVVRRVVPGPAGPVGGTGGPVGCGQDHHQPSRAEAL